tara:strand:+ start:85 stop:540 length:456 start_codon:yes stop_codon:yes gene_type:complete
MKGMKMTKASIRTTMPKNWVSSPLTRALCASGLNTSHKIRKASNMSWNQVESILSGATLKPHGKTIQKLMAVSGISRQQYGGHTRVVNALRTPVDKSIVKKATTRMVASKKPKAIAARQMSDDTIIQIISKGQTMSINIDQLLSAASVMSK